jgi:hypothetical protein
MSGFNWINRKRNDSFIQVSITGGADDLDNL